jgi:hypothetical protein
LLAKRFNGLRIARRKRYVLSLSDVRVFVKNLKNVNLGGKILLEIREFYDKMRFMKSGKQIDEIFASFDV